MKIDRIRIYGFEPAFHGMRNSRESWDKSDSTFYLPNNAKHYPGTYDKGTYTSPELIVPECPIIGQNDMELALKLVRSGTEHRKFLRQIMIWWDLYIPRYVWQEMDTYKVSTVRNSNSSMDKLGVRDLTQDDFQQPIPDFTIRRINELALFLRQSKIGQMNVEVRDARRALKNELPEGYLQLSTHSLTYETALSIIRQRHNHRLDEWHYKKPGSICWTLLTLPYLRVFAEASGVSLEPSEPKDIA